MLGGSLVTTASRVLRLRMEGNPPDTEGSCEYIKKEVADSRKGWFSSLEVGRWAANPHRKNLSIVTKCFKVPRTWTDLFWYDLSNGKMT